MNSHLTQEELILRYYGEPEPGRRAAHLDACEPCRAELARLAAVLDRITPGGVPEPGDDYESRVWDRLAWRLRGEKKRHRGVWMKWTAAAALVAVAFAAGLFWNRRTIPSPGVVATQTATATSATSPPIAQTAAPAAPRSEESAPRDRILLVVVGDHIDQSERMLVELTNLTPADGVDLTRNRARAEELLASNRLYRRTALDRGEESVATLLDELEPVLLQIAHAPESMSADELRRIQKRVESKGLVFKLRVVRAGVSHRTEPRPAPPTT